MKSWLILPRDPLIFRDGKPFTAAPGSRSKTLPMPFPSTLAGAVRTMVGTDSKTGQFDKDLIASLLRTSVTGPILVEIKDNGDIKEFFLPAPGDALFIRTDVKSEAMRYNLKPLAVKEPEVIYDLKDLEICAPSEIIKEKPHSEPPAFWNWKSYYDWLLDPKQTVINLSELGISQLPKDVRTHVGIDPNSKVAEEGALFQTTALEFLLQDDDKNQTPSKKARNFGILVFTEANLKNGFDYLGGEKRITRWELKDIDVPFKSCPKELKEKILSDGYCRLILVTPAYFEQGYLPEISSVNSEVTVIAVINDRYQTVSGWDYKLGQPKPTRRLTPAGSVYFLRLPPDREQAAAFIDSVWFKHIGDDDQLKCDGFGLALLGAWDGKDLTLKMEVKK